MDTRFWGPSGWRLLHLTLEAPLGGRSFKHIRTVFELVPYVLPCKFCRKSLSEYYEERPIPNEYDKMGKWLYHVHNEVNNKLRKQSISVEPDPTYTDIQNRYEQWTTMPCASTQILGWDFLFSIANTTPSKTSASTPMEDAPTDLSTPVLRNKWNTMNYKERLPYIQKWWDLLGDVLPFEQWRTVWKKAARLHGKAPVKNGKRAVLNWLFKMEQTICKSMAESAPHDSFSGLCKEVSTFSSGCGKKTSPNVKTCRAKKNAARETLRLQRNARFSKE